jgi:hypothetical protein
MIKKILTASMLLSVALSGVFYYQMDAAKRRTGREIKAAAQLEWTEADIQKGRDAEFVKEVQTEAASGAAALDTLLKKKKLKKYPKNVKATKQADYYKDVAAAIETAVKASSGSAEAKDLAEDFVKFVTHIDAGTKKAIEKEAKLDLDDKMKEMKVAAVAPGGGADAVAARFARIKKALEETAAAIKAICDDIALATNAAAKFDFDKVKTDNNINAFNALVAGVVDSESAVKTYYEGLAAVADKQKFVDDIEKLKTDSEGWIDSGAEKKTLLTELEKMQADAVADEKAEIQKVLDSQIGYADAFKNDAKTTIAEFMGELENFLVEFKSDAWVLIDKKDKKLAATYSKLVDFFAVTWETGFKKTYAADIKTVADAKDLKNKINDIKATIDGKEINTTNVFAANIKGWIGYFWSAITRNWSTKHRTHNSMLNSMHEYAFADSAAINKVFTDAGGVPNLDEIKNLLSLALAVKTKVEKLLEEKDKINSADVLIIKATHKSDFKELATLNQTEFDAILKLFTDIKNEDDAKSFAATMLPKIKSLEAIAQDWNKITDAKPAALLKALKKVKAAVPVPPPPPSAPSPSPLPAPSTPSAPSSVPSPVVVTPPTPSSPAPAPVIVAKAEWEKVKDILTASGITASTFADLKKEISAIEAPLLAAAQKAAQANEAETKKIATISKLPSGTEYLVGVDVEAKEATGLFSKSSNLEKEWKDDFAEGQINDTFTGKVEADATTFVGEVTAFQTLVNDWKVGSVKHSALLKKFNDIIDATVVAINTHLADAKFSELTDAIAKRNDWYSKQFKPLSDQAGALNNAEKNKLLNGIDYKKFVTLDGNYKNLKTAWDDAGLWNNGVVGANADFTKVTEAAAKTFKDDVLATTAELAADWADAAKGKAAILIAAMKKIVDDATASAAPKFVVTSKDLKKKPLMELILNSANDDLLNAIKKVAILAQDPSQAPGTGAMLPVFAINTNADGLSDWNKFITQAVRAEKVNIKDSVDNTEKNQSERINMAKAQIDAISDNICGSDVDTVNHVKAIKTSLKAKIKN